MKRILVKDNLNTRISSLGKLIREGNRLIVDLNKKINPLKKYLREGERSVIDLQALQKVQEQFDNFIKQMIEAKVLLAGLEIGGDDAYYEDYERETSETGEIE
jgi:predicted DNA-binding antitoxin AbrB/MazE fold protein